MSKRLNNCPKLNMSLDNVILSQCRCHLRDNDDDNWKSDSIHDCNTNKKNLDFELEEMEKKRIEFFKTNKKTVGMAINNNLNVKESKNNNLNVKESKNNTSLNDIVEFVSTIENNTPFILQRYWSFEFYIIKVVTHAGTLKLKCNITQELNKMVVSYGKVSNNNDRKTSMLLKQIDELSTNISTCPVRKLFKILGLQPKFVNSHCIKHIERPTAGIICGIGRCEICIASFIEHVKRRNNSSITTVQSPVATTVQSPVATTPKVTLSKYVSSNVITPTTVQSPVATTPKVTLSKYLPPNVITPKSVQSPATKTISNESSSKTSDRILTKFNVCDIFNHRNVEIFGEGILQIGDKWYCATCAQYK
jgi:hypothetical protein